MPTSTLGPSTHAQNLPTSSFSSAANRSMKAACTSRCARVRPALHTKKPITAATATPSTMYGTLLDFLVNERLGSSALGSSMGPPLYHGGNQTARLLHVARPGGG